MKKAIEQIKDWSSGMYLFPTIFGCGFQYHRDGLGAYNIRRKYLGELETPQVVGAMASPIGVRYAV